LLTRLFIAPSETPAPRSSARVTIPCEPAAIRASSCSTVLPAGRIPTR